MEKLSATKVFLSYSRDNKTAVEPIETALAAQGVQIWRDERNLRLGQRWPTILGDAIASNDIFLLAWSKDAARSEFVDLEWNTAVASRKTIIPWQLDDTPLPAALGSYQAIPPGRKRGEIVDDLLLSISRQQGKDEPKPPGEGQRPGWRPTAIEVATVFAFLLITVYIGFLLVPDEAPVAHAVAGMIRDGNGEPLTGVEVSLPELGVSSRTNHFGRFELIAETPTRERIELMARKDGYRTYETFVTPGNEGLGLILRKRP